MTTGPVATSATATPPAAPPSEYAIEARDLVKTYPGGARALAGLSFAVPAGTIFGLLGPNGAGTSTAPTSARCDMTRQ
jgi:ABC-2 type transport system ATP-binding protein